MRETRAGSSRKHGLPWKQGSEYALFPALRVPHHTTGLFLAFTLNTQYLLHLAGVKQSGINSKHDYRDVTHTKCIIKMVAEH